MDTAVAVVKAYLELCGYFVLAELPVRAADAQGSRGGEGYSRHLGYRDVTDLDIVAVGFPHGQGSLQRRPMQPVAVFLGADRALGGSRDGVDLIIGEVKEGQARLNPALLRAETVAFALRRAGCCPEEIVEMESRIVVQDGERLFTMPGGTPCRVRVVAFAGHGEASERGVRTISLAHCAAYIGQRLKEAEDVLAGAQFKDPVLSLFALQGKLARLEHHNNP